MKKLFLIFLFYSCSPSATRSPSSEPLQFEFVTIEPGYFLMGSPVDELGRDKDETQKEIILQKKFQIMKTEVTQYQWASVMGNNPSYFVSRNICVDYSIINGVRMCPNLPVENVSYHDVMNFITKLNKTHRHHYRLPTEAQWEFAARANIIGSTPLDELSEKAWYFSNSNEETHPVATKAPNEFGLYDMLGNVWEWVASPYTFLQSKDVYFIMRGGSWQATSNYCRLASKDYGKMGFKDKDLGFRLVRDVISD